MKRATTWSPSSSQLGQPADRAPSLYVSLATTVTNEFVLYSIFKLLTKVVFVDTIALKPSCNHTVKKVSHFPIPSWDVTYQTLPGREGEFPGRV